MTTAHLVRPNTKYQATFLEAFKEDEKEMDEDLNVIAQDFDHYVKFTNEKSQALNLPPGYVPETIFWLIDKDEYIGQTGIRHYLTDNLRKEGGHIGYYIRPAKRKMGYGTVILKLALQEAKKLGIEKAMVTCNETNVGSRKIIEANGGIFDHENVDQETEIQILRFWVNT